MDFVSVLIAAFIVGVLVGITGMGGGALMTPALLALGINPTAAVANDLVASSFSRSTGAIMHWRQGSPNIAIVKWLVIGSVPSAFAGAFIIESIGPTDTQQVFVKIAIGVALLFAAATYVLRIFTSSYKIQKNNKKPPANPRIRPLPTLLAGALGGLLVGLTSVGAGSVIMVVLLLLYPGLKAVKLVGTDLVQAVPLVIAAAASHVITTGVQWAVLLPLIIGSTPGTYLGSKLAPKIHQKYVRRGIVTVLVITGMSLLGVTPWLAVLVGLGALSFGVLGLPTVERKLNQTALLR